ncbi:cutinase family protein [Nocardia sp. CDC159]|uniref:Cutinase family protein n=1 Tax=Nocardia pulmonis TaxID=2951408 RepID=A0A9X2IZI7_9NOCA|nr:MULTISPECIES: cutinase family protein [Nocardia]MCM6777548.1 cutinase family protein [Nocardia pulmonis]MCM6790345.1 cutinase family protein [Nocardia sp. CDC159]
MSFREFLGRHRIVSAIAAPAALGVAAVVAVAVLPSATKSHTADTQLKASVTECKDMVTISVAGRGDTPASGTTKMLVGPNGEELPAALSGDHRSTWVDPVVNAPAGAVDPNSYAAVYIAYPANMATYEDAVNAGATNAKRVMTEIRKACPNTRFAIVGYSEGADVVRRVAMEVGNQQADKDGKYGIVDPNNVVGVVILADSGRSAGDGTFIGSKDPTRPDNFDQKYQNGNVKPVSGQGALPGTSGGFGALNGKVASFCSEGDLTCAAPQNISLLQLVVNVGRQINADKLEREGLNPATGQDVAVALGRIALDAFGYIAAQPNWMASDETFLQVLLRVSDPAYKPGQTPPPAPKADAIAKEQMSPLAYLPQKVFNEIVGLIVTNQNTIPVIMSDPYQLTLGPNATGHHFDYWRNADSANGRPMTSAEYAAAWLTHLAKQAQAGEQLDTNYKPNSEDLATAYRAAEQAKKEKENVPVTTTTTAPASTTTSTTSPVTSAPSSTTTAAPTTTVTGSSTTTTAPGTTAPTTTSVAPTTTATVAPTTTTAAPTTTTTSPASTTTR